MTSSDDWKADHGAQRVVEPAAMAHSTPDRKPGQTAASEYSFGLFHGYTVGHKVDYY